MEENGTWTESQIKAISHKNHSVLLEFVDAYGDLQESWYNINKDTNIKKLQKGRCKWYFDNEKGIVTEISNLSSEGEVVVDKKQEKIIRQTALKIASQVQTAFATAVNTPIDMDIDILSDDTIRISKKFEDYINSI